MTREEAKEVFFNRGYVKVNGGEIFDGNLWRQSYTVISEWLKGQEFCEDCISRQAVNTLVDELARAISDERCYMSRGRAASSIMQDILDLPSVTPKQKMGHWIKIEPYPLQMHDYKCSECGHETDDNIENYCSERGAKMAERNCVE